MFKFKKFVSLFLVASLMLTICLPFGSASDTEDAPVLDYEFLSNSNIHAKDGAVIIERDSVASPHSRSASDAKKEVVVLVPREDVTTDTIIDSIDTFLNARSSGSKYEEDCDSTLSVKAYTTIFYDRKTENQREYVRLTKVTGGFDIMDRNVVVESQQLSYGQGSAFDTPQSATKTPTTWSWSYTTPSSWGYTYYNIEGSSLNAIYTLNMRHGTSSRWSMQLVNDLFNNMSPIQ